jgi:hypothetical protein
VLIERGIPFLFATGYGIKGIPSNIATRPSSRSRSARRTSAKRCSGALGPS